MMTVYGPAPEFFETQEAAIRKFSAPKSTINGTDILIVVAGFIVVSVLIYYAYQHAEENKKQQGSVTG